MNDRQLVSLLGRAGFRGKSLRTAFGIAKRESGGRADAHNPNRATGDDSYGIFQINMLGEMGPARRKQFGLSSNEDLYDPLTSAKAAFRMSNGGKDFGAWGIGENAYRSGAGYETIAKWAETAPVGPPQRGEAKAAREFKLPEFKLPSFEPPKWELPDFDLGLEDPPGFGGNSRVKIDDPPGWKQQSRAGAQLIDPLPPIVAEKKARRWGGTTLDQGPAAAPNPKIAKAIAIAKQQIGKPYVFGSAGAGSFDCSGLIEYSFEQAGIKTPGRLTTGPMAKMGQKIEWDSIQPGDWIVKDRGGTGHVVMYVGNGQVIAAPYTGAVVQFQPLSKFKAQSEYQVRRWHG